MDFFAANAGGDLQKSGYSARRIGERIPPMGCYSEACLRNPMQKIASAAHSWGEVLRTSGFFSTSASSIWPAPTAALPVGPEQPGDNQLGPVSPQ